MNNKDTTDHDESPFVFIPNPYSQPTIGSHVGRIPQDVSSKEQLLDILKDELRLPDYFGRNWDALSDCLRDLSWLEPGRIVLVHAALPALAQVDLKNYLRVLEAAVNDWKPGEHKEFIVVFPERERQRTVQALRG